MKIGLSSYSLSRAIRAGEMSILDAISWVAENGGEHIELVPFGYSFTEQPELIDAVKKQAADCGIDLSSYTIGANFATAGEDGHEITPEEYRAEIERVKREVEIGAKLGVRLMRHDAASRPREVCAFEQFERDLPKVADACRIVADHAAQFGITTSVENHGYLFQSAERVRRLVRLVDRPNYRTTLDVGNFLCADELPLAALKTNLDIASMIHFKDFYIRDRVPTTETCHVTRAGRYLRGAVTGFGDVDLYGIVEVIKASDFDGYLSIEFEGIEECRLGSRLSLNNVKALFGRG